MVKSGGTIRLASKSDYWFLLQAAHVRVTDLADKAGVQPTSQDTYMYFPFLTTTKE